MARKGMTDSKKSVQNKKKTIAKPKAKSTYKRTHRVPQPDYKPAKKKKVGGQYPPPPRESIASKLSDYKLALVKLNADLLDNIKYIISVRNDTEQGVHTRLKAAEILLKRTMPEIKSITKVDGTNTPDEGYSDDELKEMAKIYSKVVNKKPITRKKKK